MFANPFDMNRRNYNKSSKRDLRKNNMLGQQGSDERLYMIRKFWGRGLKSLREVYEKKSFHAGCDGVIWLTQGSLETKNKKNE